MAAERCLIPIKLCAVRVTALNEVGGPTDEYWVSDQIITLGFTPVNSEGQDREVRNGCDCIIAADKADDIFKRFTLEISKGALEPGMEAAMLGQDPILDPATPTAVIGINYPADQITSCTNRSRVALEGWSQAFNVDHQDTVYPWIHYRWPMTSWALGANTLGADFALEALTGFSITNPEFGDPYDDLPLDGTNKIDSSVFSWWYTADDPPTAACGVQDLTP